MAIVVPQEGARLQKQISFCLQRGHNACDLALAELTRGPDENSTGASSCDCDCDFISASLKLQAGQTMLPGCSNSTFDQD